MDVHRHDDHVSLEFVRLVSSPRLVADWSDLRAVLEDQWSQEWVSEMDVQL